jgi:hypothetical protein
MDGSSLEKIKEELAQKYYGVSFSKLCCERLKNVEKAAILLIQEKEKEKEGLAAPTIDDKQVS